MLFYFYFQCLFFSQFSSIYPIYLHLIGLSCLDHKRINFFLLNSTCINVVPTHLYIVLIGLMKKLIWIMLSLATLTMLVVHMFYLVSQYLKYETTTVISVVPHKLIDFPGRWYLLLLRELLSFVHYLTTVIYCVKQKLLLIINNKKDASFKKLIIDTVTFSLF